MNKIENKSLGGNTDFLDVLRWMATFAVVYYHVLNAAKSYVDMTVNNNQLWYDLLAVPLRWHVPTFLMISGALFLNPRKSISYYDIFRKYVKRLLLSLIVFGYVFCLAELVLKNNFSISIFYTALVNLLCGETWSHMWYLYMMIGIYLVVPICKKFLDNASRDEVYCFIGILVVFTSIFPAIDEIFNIKIGFNIPFKPYYITYFIGGGILMHFVDIVNIQISKVYTVLIVSLLVIISNAIFSLNLPLSTGSPVLMCITICIFIIAKHYKFKSRLLSKYRGLSFGVYLTHMIFINALYKVFHVSPFDFPVYMSVICLGTIFLICSLATTYILTKIPYLKNIL